MQRLLSLVLVISIIFGTALPISAFATEAQDAVPDTATSTQLDEISNDGATIEGGETQSGDGSATESLGESSDTNTLTESDELPFDPIYEATEDGGSISIMPMSGWAGEDSEFFTKVRLTVTDRQGNPVQGAVYGLYRADNDQLVEYLETDRYGVATSGDVPVDMDYYLLEYSTPTGFQPNDERKDIIYPRSVRHPAWILPPCTIPSWAISKW